MTSVAAFHASRNAGSLPGLSFGRQRPDSDTAIELEERSDSTSRDALVQVLRDDAVSRDGYAAFEGWAEKKGRGVPPDLAIRSVALEPMAKPLRKATGLGDGRL